jgi:hypothetical protein
MRRGALLLLFVASCGSDQSFEYDLYPIQLARAPIQPGGEAIGGLLAKVNTPVGVQPLLVDTAFPFNSLGRGGCPAGVSGWTYTGNIDLLDGWNPAAPLRASFDDVGLFDICPGLVGDSSVQPVGVVGGSLLANFSVGFTFPSSASQPALMSLWPSYPATDDQLAQDGWVSLRFNLRGSAAVAQGNGEASLTLPNSRTVLAACAAPRAFATTDPQETCAKGEVTVKSSGENLLLALGTGEGPLILGQSAWARVANQMGLSPDAGTTGDLYTAYSTDPISARFVSLPRLALLQGTTDNTWTGACAELASARRIEWVLANQTDPPNPAVCFQPCDASGGQALATRAYLELGGPLLAAVVSETSAVIGALNGDVPPNAQVDGIIGAGTLAGTRLRIDYPAQPQGRVVADCEDAASRDTCWTAPSCPSPSLSSNGQTHTCFGQPPPPHGWAPAPVCP